MKVKVYTPEGYKEPSSFPFPDRKPWVTMGYHHAAVVLVDVLHQLSQEFAINPPFNPGADRSDGQMWLDLSRALSLAADEMADTGDWPAYTYPDDRPFALTDNLALTLRELSNLVYRHMV